MAANSPQPGNTVILTMEVELIEGGTRCRINRDEFNPELHRRVSSRPVLKEDVADDEEPVLPKTAGKTKRSKADE